MKPRKVKGRKSSTRQSSGPAPGVAETTSRQPMAEEEGRLRESRRLNESIEDPLEDWPESAEEPDEWLEERRTPNDEP